MSASITQQAALAFAAAGLSFIPTDPQTKRPTNPATGRGLGWKQYQRTPAPEATVSAWFQHGHAGGGIITGAVSAPEGFALEVLDFDREGLFDLYAEAFEHHAPGLLDRLPLVATQSGGRHLYYHAPREVVQGNQKLAHGRVDVTDEPFRAEGSKRMYAVEYGGKEMEGIEDPAGSGRWYIKPVIIETRGEGGYVVAPPSPGYRLISGPKLTEIPTITAEEHALLHTVARSFNEWPRQVGPETPRTQGEGVRPGDDFNERGWPECRALLEGSGWTHVRTRRDGTEEWRRPGKREGLSATYGHEGGGFYNFSSNAHPFESEESYSPFAVYAMLQHGGDYSAAARELAADGFGERNGVPHPSASVSASVGVPDWPQPQPIRHTSERFPVPPFDLAWLPALVRAWVADVAHRMQIALDFPAVAAMVMLSGCIGRRVAIRPKRRDGWAVICNLWGLIVGRPGLMKSPVLKQITAPLVRLHVEAQKEHADALQAHEAALLAFEAQKAAVKEQMKKALKTNPHADVSDLAADLIPPDPPKRTELVVWDATPEALIETARDNPSGFTQIRDEASGLIARLSAPNAGEERALYLSSWNGDEPTAQKRIGRGYVSAEAVCQAFLGGIQPGKLTELVGGAIRGGMGDDGMVQRFQLMVQPDLPDGFELVDKWPDGEAKRSAYDLVHSLVNLCPSGVGAEQDTGLDGEPEGVPYLRFDPEAQVGFNDWLTALERRLRGGALHPALESHFAKYRSLVPSLALILHLADGAHGPVSRLALDRALGWAGYLEAHALRVYGMAQAPGEAGARQLARKVLTDELGARFSVRTVYRKGWSGLGSREEAQAAVDLLVDQGWLREETATHGKRSFTEYVVNPRLAEGDRRTLLPRRDPPLTHRRMVTHDPAEPHTSAYVSASVPPSVSETTGDGTPGPLPDVTWDDADDLGEGLDGQPGEAPF